MHKYSVPFNITLMLILFAILALEVSPLVQVIPGRDSGVFLYIGQRILNGQVPYRDVWDHKGPLLYFLNALGLWLAGGSVWGVWSIQFAFLGITFPLSYLSIKRAMGYFPTLLATVFWPVSLLQVLEGGNFTEQYSLTINFLAIFLYTYFSSKKNVPLFPILMGILLAMNGLLRQNNVGVEITIFLIYLFFSLKTNQERAQFMMYGVVGGTVVVVPLLVYLLVTQALPAFLDEYIRYNLVYVHTDFINRIGSIWFGIYIFKGLFLVPFLGWLVSMYLIFKRVTLSPSVRSIALLAMINFPLEIVLSALAGRGYSRYYMNWIPAIFLLCAVLVWFIQKQVLPFLKSKFSRQLLIGTYAILLLSLVWIPSYLAVLSYSASYLSIKDKSVFLKSEIDQYVSKGGFLLIWGGDASINFLTGHPSPSRFVYQSPLYMPGYQSAVLIDEFLAGIETTHPVIIDTSPTNWLIPPIDHLQRADWKCDIGYCQVLPEMSSVFSYIQQHYRLVGILSSYSWPIYQYSG